MDRTFLRFLRDGSAEQIIEALQTRQHLRPHQPLIDAVVALAEQVGFCPDAATKALKVLSLDAHRPVGRLRSSELMQLGRVIHRLWRHRLTRADATSH